MKTMDKIYTKDPCLGTRKLVTVLERDHGLKMNRKHIQRLRQGRSMPKSEAGRDSSWEILVEGKGQHGCQNYAIRIVTRASRMTCDQSVDPHHFRLQRHHAIICQSFSGEDNLSTTGFLRPVTTRFF